MPTRPGRACRIPNCGSIVVNMRYQGFCDTHKGKVSWGNDRGNRHKRGYGKQWVNVSRPDAFTSNHNKYLSLYKQSPDSFTIHSWPNLQTLPLQGFCVDSFNKGVVRVGTHVDHIKSKAHGGSDNQSNLQILSAYEHSKKTGRN